MASGLRDRYISNAEVMVPSPAPVPCISLAPGQASGRRVYRPPVVWAGVRERCRPGADPRALISRLPLLGAMNPEVRAVQRGGPRDRETSQHTGGVAAPVAGDR